jgi:hypothetical protein
MKQVAPFPGAKSSIMNMNPTIGHPWASLGKSTWSCCAGVRDFNVLACRVLSLKGSSMVRQHA